MSTKVNVRLPDALALKIEETAKLLGQTRSDVMVDALDRVLLSSAGLPDSDQPSAPAAAVKPSQNKKSRKRSVVIDELRESGAVKVASELPAPVRKPAQRTVCPYCEGPVASWGPHQVRCFHCQRNLPAVA